MAKIILLPLLRTATLKYERTESFRTSPLLRIHLKGKAATQRRSGRTLLCTHQRILGSRNKVAPKSRGLNFLKQ